MVRLTTEIKKSKQRPRTSFDCSDHGSGGGLLRCTGVNVLRSGSSTGRPSSARRLRCSSISRSCLRREGDSAPQNVKPAPGSEADEGLRGGGVTLHGDVSAALSVANRQEGRPPSPHLRGVSTALSGLSSIVVVSLVARYTLRDVCLTFL